MLSTSFMLLLSGAFLMLRIGENTGSFPRPLSAKDERKYAELSQQGDMEARNKLIEHNLRLVVHIVKKYYAADGDAEDLISIGTMGLIKAVSGYRTDKGVRLATYASRCIENEILMHFRAAKKSAQDVSLSEMLDPEGEGGGPALMDTLSVPDDMLETVSRAEQRRRLRAAVSKTLTERETEVITLRYGLDGTAPLPQRAVAEKMGISRSYISRIEKKALEKLKSVLEDPSEENIAGTEAKKT